MKHRLQTLAIVVLSLVSLSSSAFIAVNWSKLSNTESRPVGERRTYKKAASARKPAAIPTESNRRDLALMSAIQTKSNELQACYNDFLQRTPTDNEGALRMSWVIDPQGQVNSVSLLDSELDDTVFSDCVVARVKNWSFKAAPDTPSFLVTHKFTFRPKGTAVADF